MKRLRIVILFFVIIILSITKIYASQGQDDMIKEQQEEFGIQNFLKSSKEYMGEFFEDVDVNDILQDAMKGEVDNGSLAKRFLSLLGKEFVTSIKALGSILAIIVIHSVLKSISESLENDNISKLIYYVQYILIITIVLTSFSDIVKMVQDTTTNLVAFMNMLVPLLITLMMSTGSIATSGVIEPIILFMINFIGNMIQDVLLPLIMIFVALVILSKLSSQVKIDKLSKFMKSGIVWFLGIILTIFVGVVSLEGTMSSSVDGITAKTTKAVVSSAIPVVGKILGDAVDTVLGCGIILKNAIGLVGVIIILGICIVPIIKLSLMTILYKLLAGITQPIADEKITSLLEQIGDIFKMFLAILSSISFMIIIGTTLVLKISNSGMMYR
ncbi:MAG: stage III sporulation protein AE [Clostridia bacterium]|nr:stage III sporulation protein AE [Clostridia bacterium]